MNKFTYRLAYYLFGVLGGSIILFFVLNQKKASCSYFPNERVLNHIRTKPFYYSTEATKSITQKWVDTTDIKNTLTYGDVDFDRSNIKTKNGGKLYIIEGFTIKKHPIELTIENFEDKAILKKITKK